MEPESLISYGMMVIFDEKFTFIFNGIGNLDFGIHRGLYFMTIYKINWENF